MPLKYEFRSIAKDSLRQNHEADITESLYQRRPRRPLDSRQPRERGRN